MATATKVRVINKYFVEVTYETGTPYIVPNPFEMAKQHCILDATRWKSLSLPRFGYDVYNFDRIAPDLLQWCYSLGFQNSPTKINWRSNPELFKQLVEPLDFSKPFDQDVVDRIKEQFTVDVKQAQLDATDFINAELEGE